MTTWGDALIACVIGIFIYCIVLYFLAFKSYKDRKYLIGNKYSDKYKLKHFDEIIKKNHKEQAKYKI